MNTTATIADKLGVSQRRVQQLIKELGIKTETVGQTQIIPQTALALMKKRETKAGRKKACIISKLRNRKAKDFIMANNTDDANCEQTGDYSEGCCCDTCQGNGYGTVYSTDQTARLLNT